MYSDLFVPHVLVGRCHGVLASAGNLSERNRPRLCPLPRCELLTLATVTTSGCRVACMRLAIAVAISALCRRGGDPYGLAFRLSLAQRNRLSWCHPFSNQALHGPVVVLVGWGEGGTRIMLTRGYVLCEFWRRRRLALNATRVNPSHW